MEQTSRKRERFIEVFQLPPAMVPYLDVVADEREIDLVLALAERPMTAAEVAQMMGLSAPEADEFLARALYRQVIDKTTEDGVVTYSPATFYSRLNPLAMYDNWGDVPPEAREAVIEWDMQEFIEQYRPVIEALQEDPDAFHRIPNRDVLLLDEALAQVEAATEHVVVPCDCRAITMACNRPSEVCIRLDEGARLTLEYGHGRRLTKEECKEIVVDANRAGLMQTGLRDWQGHDLFGFCNCCGCCCFPFRAGIRLGIEKQWPRSHHVATRDLKACVHCGECASRCYFDAFYQVDAAANVNRVNGTVGQMIQFDPEKCWGCGICATACPEGAITMTPLRESIKEESET